ncbi:MAG: hypothetical protein POELPBGB_02755 [Bacteroidia bacterium]|nr:hypothetical protein [Bacteroidia bacterium]
MNLICITYVLHLHFFNPLNSVWVILSAFVTETILLGQLLTFLLWSQHLFENTYLLCDGHNGNRDKLIASVAATTKWGISQFIL